MNIIYATPADLDYLKRDPHISSEAMAEKIRRQEVLVAKVEHVSVGWLRFVMFSDVIPFMSMLYVEEDYRRKGIGTSLINFWEVEPS